jgi:hypothetical protein
MLGCGILIAYASSCYAQDKLHCIPLNESRIIHQMAHESLLVPELKGKIELLEAEKVNYRKTFDELIALERVKTRMELEKFEVQVKVSSSYESQLKALEKEARKARRGRDVAIGLGIILIVVSVVK